MKALTVLILVLVAATANAASHRPRCFGAAARDPEHPCVNHRLNRTVTPKPADAVIQPSAPCAIIRRTKPAVCAFGTKDVKPTVALIGDSHARHWVAALTRVAHRDRWRGVSITRTRCPFSFARKPDHPCIGWVRRDLRWLREHPKVSTVYVSSDANSGVDAPPDQA
ncbi:MAG: hypothetical protein QOI80_2869, partial [Solirubrobacteraceae bacterium]|nr:hypothetical protein [Solirubrobacteraceae bacterium]